MTYLIFILLLINFCYCDQKRGECNDCIERYIKCMNSAGSTELRCDCIKENINCLNDGGCHDNYETICENYGCENCREEDNMFTIVLIIGIMLIVLIFSIWAIIYLRCKKK